MLDGQHSADRVRWGGTSVYNIVDPVTKEKRVVMVSQDVHYAHRGPNLRQLCLLEYGCLIEVVPRKESPASETDEDDLARRPNKRRPKSTPEDFWSFHPSPWVLLSVPEATRHSRRGFLQSQRGGKGGA